MACKVWAEAQGSVPQHEARRVLKVYRERQDDYHLGFLRDAPYVGAIRRQAVDRLWQLCELARLDETTAHVATRFFDRVMQHPHGLDVPLALLGVVCVRLAAKFEQREEDVPSLERLLGRRISRDDARRATDAEVALANALGWDLYTITSLHVVELLNKADELVVDRRGDLLGGAAAVAADATAFVRSYTVFFANMALQSPYFLALDPCLLGAAIVLATRQLLCITPHWPNRLAEATRFRVADLHSTAALVLERYSVEFADHAKSVGHFAGKAQSPKNVADSGAYRDIFFDEPSEATSSDHIFW
ncbi:hypothetical protein M885DRAFT_512846 [Pelagophyceae sp. CCMP2097]|nr:hypothetical protein M885DRAFT_512846 [Pelagophyceae sp. CCMP2097]|mmetsp:Transcript_10696/g.35529  ORF Transcript_10696/g.35529 Transcript_10696/m.35529 type:complete len:304 (+) Transcript_10696:96-1007(+)